MKAQKTNPAIQLDDRFCILVLPIEYALAHTRIDKSGRKRRDVIGYFASIERCLQEFVKQAGHDDLRAKGDTSLSEAVETISRAVERCTALIRECFPEYRDKR